MSTDNDKLSYSRTYSYLKCLKMYQYSYIDKLTPKAGTVSVESWLPRQRGQIIHGGMEYALLGKDIEAGCRQAFQDIVAPEETWKQAAGDAQRLALEGIMEELIQVTKNAADFLGVEDFEPVMHNGFPMVEVEVTHPLPGWKSFTGYVDVVVKHKPSGRVFVMDYKSVTRFNAAEDEVYRVQMIAYTKALKSMGVHVDGALILSIKPELARRPPRKIRIDSGTIDTVRESEDGKFMLVPTLYGAEYVDNVWANFEKMALAMANFKAEDAYTNISSYGCNFCDFKILCQAELSGGDAEYIRSSKYSSRNPGRKSLTVTF